MKPQFSLGEIETCLSCHPRIVRRDLPKYKGQLEVKLSN